MFAANQVLIRRIYTPPNYSRPKLYLDFIGLHGANQKEYPMPTSFWLQHPIPAFVQVDAIVNITFDIECLLVSTIAHIQKVSSYIRTNKMEYERTTEHVIIYPALANLDRLYGDRIRSDDYRVRMECKKNSSHKNQSRCIFNTQMLKNVDITRYYFDRR